jgi:hypothetical protein
LEISSGSLQSAQISKYIKNVRFKKYFRGVAGQRYDPKQDTAVSGKEYVDFKI